jgi:hypothetical protein
MLNTTSAQAMASDSGSGRRRAKRLLGAFVLASGFACTGLNAGWEWVEGGASIRHYFDPATLDKSGDFPSVLTLHDFTVRSAEGELSARYRAEFDCKARRWRLFDFTTFTEHMANGTVVNYTDPGEGGRSSWRPIPDNPGFMRIFEFACPE